MNLLDPVSTIMTTNLTTLTSKDSVADAGKIFKSQKIHHIPIVDDGIFKGMVSKSDYLFFKRGFLNSELDKQIEEIRLNNYDITHIMTKGVAFLEPSDRINVALEIFNENIFHAIPVKKGNELVGIVTTYDIIKRLSVDSAAITAY